jgi:predicted PurR-regulated permease PerM
VWAIFCVTFDNVMRPTLIKWGVDLPLLLIFAGVIGGFIAFGVIGLIIGPVVLAVAYTLLIDWVSEKEGAAQNRLSRSITDGIGITFQVSAPTIAAAARRW